ncbi:MAG: bifunctional diguanylate cyclase/phosphodiesterase [Acidimicrobiales bacterium]|nr:bifunctional diguanylate cyclase/phosphodiesterase [Acidimicrobiales bacterium]
MTGARSALARVSPVAKVSAFAVAMAAAACVVMATMGPLPGRSAWVAAIPFVIGYALTESMVFHIEIRKQAHTFSIHEVLLVVGLFAVEPAALFVARVLGGAIAMFLIRRPPLFKAFFNVAMLALEVAVAVRVFAFFGYAAQPSLGSGFAAIASAAAADAVSVFAVFGAITIFEGRPRRRQAVDVFNAQMLVMLIAGSVGVVGAGALTVGRWQVLFLAIMGTGAVVVFRQHALTTSRFTGLQTLYAFSRTISNDVDVDRVVRTAMVDVVDIIAATSVVMIALEDGSFGPAGAYRVDGGNLAHTKLDPVARNEFAKFDAVEPVLIAAESLSPETRSTLGLQTGQVLAAELALDGERLVLIATKAADAVGVFDQASVDQVGALARQLTSTLRNGLYVRQLDEAARRDELTGLDNRGELLEKLDALAPSSDCVVVAIGLVSFDVVNETLGHATGDSMLIEAADRIVSAVQGRALSVARLNGATFAVALQGRIDRDLEDLVAAIVSGVSAHDPRSALNLDMRCRVGMAESSNLDRVDSATLVRRSDLALAEAIQKRNTTFTYTPDLDATQQRSVRLISALREAIDEEQFELWFQPKIELATGDMTGAEALIRWTHPEFGPVRPDEFIELAETAGLIGDITQLVLEMAAAEAKRWIDGGTPIKIAVNLSIHDLVDSDLPLKIQDLLSRYGLETLHLGFELTETALAADEQKVVAVLGSLKEAGFSLFVDDYGTGYSSLSYLRSLPVDTLKIDRAFVSNLATDNEDRMIVKSTIELAHSLGLEVVAEGVEDAASYEILRDFGCETAQGYFMAKPMPSAQLSEWYSDLPKLKKLLGYDTSDTPAGKGAADQGQQAANVDSPSII